MLEPCQSLASEVQMGQCQKSPLCHIWGWLPASPTALWRLIPVYTDTLFVSIGACLAGGPTHPECCFGMKLGMEPDAAENLRKGSLPSEAGRAECSYPQGFRRESQVDIIKKNPVKCPRYFGKWMTLWWFLSQAHLSWVDTRSHVPEGCPELIGIRLHIIKLEMFSDFKTFKWGFLKARNRSNVIGWCWTESITPCLWTNNSILEGSIWRLSKT